MGKLLMFNLFKEDEYIEKIYSYQDDNRYESIRCLLVDAAKKTFTGDIWKSEIAYLLVKDENPFSLACERKGMINGSLYNIALKDIEEIRNIYNFDKYTSDSVVLKEIKNFMLPKGTKKLLVAKHISRLVVELDKAKTDEEFLNVLVKFYKNHGVGKIGIYHAFKLANGELKPINEMVDYDLSKLVGYEWQKKALIDNTEAFIKGLPANNCLLYGDAGTGKSTSIKAINAMYYSKGLRVIELYKHQMDELIPLIEKIRNRNYKFVLFMDDLSFEENETEYKYLKAVIEGGAEAMPKNVVIYATSNRRHLVKEMWSDRNDMNEEIHKSDTMQEKLSLVSRFGLTINFPSPTHNEYHDIVLGLAHRYSNISISDEELIKMADRWALQHGEKSGRVAQQYIDLLLGGGTV